MCFVERSAIRASWSSVSYSRTKPSPPRYFPAPPESGINSKRRTRVENSDSMISTGAMRAFD
jgi:hypothetical protein